LGFYLSNVFSNLQPLNALEKESAFSKLIFTALCFLHGFLSVNALAGGCLLMVKPSGALLGMQKDWLDDSVFSNYFIPGLLLFSMMGLVSLICLIGLIRKPQWSWAQRLNLYEDKHWSWAYSIYAGIISIAWIIIQQVMTRYFWIQSIILSIGLLILVFTLHPIVMARYKQNTISND